MLPGGIERRQIDEAFLEVVANTLAGIVRHRRSRDELTAARDQLASIFSSVDDAIWSVSPSGGRVLFASPACERLTGYPIAKLMNDPDLWVRQIHPDDTGRIKPLIDGLTRGGAGYDIEYRIIPRDGRVMWIRERTKVARDSNGRLLRIDGVTSDVTEHKNFEVELEQKRESLIEQNRTTGAFLGILEITAASQNFTEAVNKLLPLIARLTDCRSCSVFFVNRADQTLQPTHSWGLSHEALAHFISSKPGLDEVNELLALSGRETTFIDHVSKARIPPKLKELLRRLKAKAAIVLPIIYAEEMQALMIFAYPRTWTFTARDKEIAVKLGKHLEASHTDFRHSRDLLRQTMQLAQQLEMNEAMAGIDRAILSSTSKEEVIYSAIERFGRVVASDAVEILEFDEERRRFISAAIHDADGTHFSPEAVVNHAGLKSWDHVIFGSSSYYPDLTRENLGDVYESRFQAQGYKSLLVLPLLSKGDLLGMVAVASKRVAFFVPEHLIVAQRLGNQIAVALSNAGLIRELQAVLVGTVNSLVTTLDAKSPWTRGHSRRVCEFSLELGRSLDLDDEILYKLELAALFHDVGKIGTYDVVLDKKAKLTDEEYALIKQHPGKTKEILLPIPRLKEVAEIAGHHHERWDGRGYPDGQIGENIPYLSRITALADSFDAMSSDRPYRKGLTKNAALDEIARCAGSQFDPELAHEFIHVMREERKGPAQKRAA